MNNVVLIGRLTKDPTVVKRDENNDPSVANFTLAVERPRRQGEDQSADFIRIVTFGKQAATCDKYLSKGRQTAVLGRIQTGSYKDKEGNTVYTTDVVADRVEFLGSPNGSGGNSGQTKPEPAPAETSIEEAAADVPF